MDTLKIKFWVAGISALLVAAAASAGERPVLRIGSDYSDSECLGDMSLPVCVAETWHACVSGGRDRLCPLIIPDYRPNPSRGEVSRPRYVDYQIVEALPVEPKLLPYGARLQSDDWKDMTEVRTLFRECSDGEGCDNLSLGRLSLYLRRGEMRWHVFGWAIGGGPDACNPEWDAQSDLAVALCGIYIDVPNMPWVHTGPDIEEWR